MQNPDRHGPPAEGSTASTGLLDTLALLGELSDLIDRINALL